MATKQASEAARLLGKRSVRARKERWGEAEFVRRLREYGKRGGRPPKAAKPKGEAQ